MAVTAFANEAALKADPLIEEGLTENTAADLVICQSYSARNAVRVLLSLIDQYGSSECNIALIADQKEAWYVEMYTGHQYAAVKLPADQVSAFGNEFTMEYLSDYEESIVSEELLTLPEKNGFAVYGKDNELNLFDTYSGESLTENYCHMRTWIGHQVLAPSAFGDDYDAKARYPLCFKPDAPVSLADVCGLMRNRYEGTKYDPDETGRIDMRVIGTDTAMSVHALQVYPDVPARMACVTWESTGPAIYGVFVPISNAVNSISEAYGNNQPASEAGVFEQPARIRGRRLRCGRLSILCLQGTDDPLRGTGKLPDLRQTCSGLLGQRGARHVRRNAAGSGKGIPAERHQGDIGLPYRLLQHHAEPSLLRCESAGERCDVDPVRKQQHDETRAQSGDT